MVYEHLVDEANEKGLTVIERYPFASPRIRGLCCDDTIAISAAVDTEAERTVILCEELTHATHTVGNILHDRRLEQRVRERIFDRLIGKAGLVRAAGAGCREEWEFADFLGVPQDFFADAMENYRRRYGTMTHYQGPEGTFALSFEPTLRVRRVVRAKRRKKQNTVPKK